MRVKGGLIINISSHAAYNAFPQWSAYCISKSCIIKFYKMFERGRKVKINKSMHNNFGFSQYSLWDSEFINSNFDKDAMLSAEEVSKLFLYFRTTQISID